MILIFYEGDDKDASANFWAWWDRNPGGYFLNCRGAKGPMLHRRGCRHFSKAEYLHDIAKRKKVCSSDQRELEERARSRGEELHKCRDCL